MKVHKSISPQMSHQQRYHRSILQRSTPAAIGRTKFQTPRQTEETIFKQGIGFNGTNINCDSDDSHIRFEPGSREKSSGSQL